MHVVTAPAAADTAAAALLDGPRRSGHVLGVTPHAVLVRVESELVAVVDRTAVRLPCSMLVDVDRVADALPEVAAETHVSIADGHLTVGAARLRPRRWWRTPRPRARDLGSLPVPRSLIDRSADIRPGPEVWSTAPWAGVVDRLLGRGPGMTPAGDDVLAGTLVTLVAAGDPRAATLSAIIAGACPERRTTELSAALLRRAARGECVPQLAAFLHAADRGGDLVAAAEALCRVGHTSGTALLAGVVAAWDLLAQDTRRAAA